MGTVMRTMLREVTGRQWGYSLPRVEHRLLSFLLKFHDRLFVLNPSLKRPTEQDTLVQEHKIKVLSKRTSIPHVTN